MPLPDVGKSSFFYTLVYWAVDFYYHIYYRSFKVVGRENIPVNKPVIYAGNHQNALMDALSILFAARGKVAFLARADMFKKKFIARILYFFRILPVYRIRDGISEMAQNEDSFRQAAEVLRKGTPLALFPEGNHAGFKRLRSLKKGICRIAFMAEEQSGFNLDLHIVPTGIDYSNYRDPGTRLLVKYGKPIRVADFTDLYKENPQKALSALRDRLSEALEPLIISISSEEHYDLYIEICQLYRGKIMAFRQIKNTHFNQVELDREIISLLDTNVPQKQEMLPKLDNNIRHYKSLIKKYGLRDWLLQKKRTGAGMLTIDVIFTLLVLPFYFYGLLFNYLPYKIPPRLTRNVKDIVFHSSIHFGIGLVLFPVFYLFYILIFSLLTKGLLIKLLFAVSLPLTGILTFYFYTHLLKLRGRARLLALRAFRRKEYVELVNLRLEIIKQIEQLIK